MKPSRPDYKRFIRFEYDDYYPSGGFNDAVGSFDSLAEAVASGRDRDMICIFDCEFRILVEWDSVARNWVCDPYEQGAPELIDPATYGLSKPGQ